MAFDHRSDPGFYKAPAPGAAYVIFFYKDFPNANPNNSHMGLGINALHCVKILRQMGVEADLFGVVTPQDIAGRLVQHPTCTHAVIQAPWVVQADLLALMRQFSRTHFLIRVHSQLAFLQADTMGIKNIRDVMMLQEGNLNLTLSANNRTLCDFLETAYQGNCVYVPNLYYDVADMPQQWRPPWNKDVLKIASFGALRPLKNHVTSAGAALQIAQSFGNSVQFHINVKRESGEQPTINAITALYTGLRYATLVQVPWQPWPQFRRLVASMDLCLQISMTETFNITTADAAAQYVPSVVSDAIEWAPPYWRARIDDVDNVAQVGVALLSSPRAGADGRRSLLQYNNGAIRTWLGYLQSNPTH